MDFEKIWILLKDRGRVARFYKEQAEALWNTYTPEQQQEIFDSIKRKIEAGNQYVDFRPHFAIKDNAPKAPQIQILSADEYYNRFYTTEPQLGWTKQFLPDQQKTIYVKQN